MSLKKQTVFGVVMCLIACVYLALIPFQVSMEPILGAGGRDKINGAFFPVIAGTFLLLTSLMLTYRTTRDKGDEETITFAEFRWAVTLVISGVIYVFLIDKIRYIPPTIGILLLLYYLLRPRQVKKYMYVVFPVMVASIIYFVFSKLFYVPLP